MAIEENTRENYLRVTHALYPFSGLQNIDADVVAYAADRGTRVHKICEGIISGLGEHGVDDETWGYVESFKQWWGDGHPVQAMEQRFWCDTHKITGQVDLIIQTPDGLCIVDLKTSYKPSPTWAAQASGYYYLTSQAGLDIKKVVFLHLSKHGKEPKLFEYPCDSSFFLAVLQVFNHFYRK